jgi:hypothetical protein
MATNNTPVTEVLHSENHAKLSAEEIAKAVAHHIKNHSDLKTPKDVGEKGKNPKKKG